MEVQSFFVVLLITSGIIVGYLLFARVLRDYISNSRFESVFSRLPPDFTCIPSKDKIIIGPTGVWLVNDGARNNPAHLSVRANTLAGKFRGRFVPDVKVQPVLLIPDSNSKTKFSFTVDSGVFLVSCKWLNKLITENPIGELDSNTISKIKLIC